MPLEHSSTDAARGRNIAKLRREGMPRDRAVAAAYREQRAAKKRNRRRARRNPSYGSTETAVSSALGALILGALVGAGAGALTQSPAATGALTGAESGVAVTAVGGLVVSIFSDKNRLSGLATAGIGLGGLALFAVASNILALGKVSGT
jgi:hypothetical protein